MASGNNITRLSPRQKMINLMYIVLTAMLALNVSSDVLEGFAQVEDGLSRSNTNIAQRNEDIFLRLEAFNEKNPAKGAEWLKKAKDVRAATASIYSYVDSLKREIVKTADGEDGDVNNIRRQDDLDAPSTVMLNPAHPEGETLRKRLDKYREFITALVPDKKKNATIHEALSTVPRNRTTLAKKNQSWEESMFENKPVVAAVTLMTKLQNDIRFAEGEALNTLLANVDARDVRVNQLNAFVIPDSRLVMRGGKYSAQIVLAAVDTTARPQIYINGAHLSSPKGLYELVAGKTGTFNYKGYLEVARGDGEIERHDFQSSYTVIEPSATVSATMMNVLYAGIDNPISISVPGVATSEVSASMTNGTLTRSGDGWVARPSAVGTDAVITVTANMDGRQQSVGGTTFRVRKLPDPSPYIAFTGSDGNHDRYKGGKPFSKTLLMQAEGLEAAIDDGILNIKFKVLSFESVFFDSMGNAIPEVSNGAQFSSRQKDSFRRLSRGKRFYISRVKAVGPDGITRDLSPMEVIVN